MSVIPVSQVGDLIDALDWPAFYGRIRASAATRALVVLEAADELSLEHGDEHAGLATLVIHHPTAMMSAVPESASALDGDQAHRLACWLYDTAHDYDRVERWRRLPTITLPSLSPEADTVVEMRDALRALLPQWAQDLAAVIAARSPGRRLVIRTEPCTSFHRRFDKAALIVIGAELVCAARCAELLEVFAHELGHAADPRLCERDVVAGEAFACELGLRLLEVQPVDAAALDALIDEIDGHSSVGRASFEERFLSVELFARALLRDPAPSPLPSAGEGRCAPTSHRGRRQRVVHSRTAAGAGDSRDELIG